MIFGMTLKNSTVEAANGTAEVIKIFYVCLTSSNKMPKDTFTLKRGGAEQSFIFSWF